MAKMRLEHFLSPGTIFARAARESVGKRYPKLHRVAMTLITTCFIAEGIYFLLTWQLRPPFYILAIGSLGLILEYGTFFYLRFYNLD